MKRKLACADFTFPLLPHAKALRLISLLEFGGVDVGLFEGRSHLWPSREFQQLEVSAAALKHQLDDLGVVCADIFLQTDPDFVPYAINHPDPKRRELAADRFRRTLDYARLAGSRHVTILPGVLFPEESETASWERMTQELSWRVAASREAGLVLGVEAHIGSIVPTPGKALELVSSVPGLTLTLDYTHFVCGGLPDTSADPLCAHASHFHVRGARARRLQTSFKDNIIDYCRIAGALDAADYQGWLGVEYVWIDWERCNECDNVSETILFRDFLRTL